MPQDHSDPLDYTELFNTQLSPEQEAAYQKWAASLGEIGNTRDYDLRGAFASGAGQAGNGHFPDTYKKPNHPTFSNESKYNGVEGLQGGRWVEDGGRTYFYAGPANKQMHGEKKLHEYFKQTEPDVQLVFPAPGL